MSGNPPCLATAFAAAMDTVGPFEPRPALAVAVSGGADSMALSILARNWARRRDGSTVALVVDHGLRASSADEASSTVERLAQLNIPARLLRLTGLTHGSALAERARIMRYEILADACRDAGILHLLLGHHAADQVETLAMRVLRGSQTHGLAGMPALRETSFLRLLRPLLAIEPAALRRFLAAAGVAWVEDPSNQDRRALRSRIRQGLAAPSLADTSLADTSLADTSLADTGLADTGLAQAMSAVAALRTREEAAIASELASRALIRPEGFALLSPGRIGPAALTCLVQTIAGARYAPGTAQMTELAARPRPATVAGVRLMPAGRFGDGLLIVREEQAVMAPVPASRQTIWDHRFRVTAVRPVPADATIGKLGLDAARFRTISDLPSAVLRTLPALRFGKSLAAVPHLRYAAKDDDPEVAVVFTPPRPVAGPCFLPANEAIRRRM